jgi:hypothetical protein
MHIGEPTLQHCWRNSTLRSFHVQLRSFVKVLDSATMREKGLVYRCNLQATL